MYLSLFSEEGFGLLGFLFKNVVVHEVSLDVFDGKIDQHASDLWSVVFSGDLLNEFIDHFSHLSLVVGVLGVNGGDQSLSLLNIGNMVG